MSCTGLKGVGLVLSIVEKRCFPPLMLTNLDKILSGGTSHHALLPCKISSKSKHVKYQKLCSKLKKLKKVTPKIVFELGTLP